MLNGGDVVEGVVSWSGGVVVVGVGDDCPVHLIS